MKVLKFGGTSLGDWERFSQVASILTDEAAQGRIAAVLSAPATITNSLIAAIDNATKGQSVQAIVEHIDTVFNHLLSGASPVLGEALESEFKVRFAHQLGQWQQKLKGIELLGYCPDEVQADFVVGGERMSAALMEVLLKAKGVQAGQLDPKQVFLAQGGILESAVDIQASRERAQNIDLNANQAWIMPGFCAANDEGQTVLLGRNGSDYSAAALAASLGASQCEIWTDVDGVYNVDPRLVNNAKLMSKLSYQEAMELSYFGAKVLHPKTITPIAQYHIPCVIKNTFNPSAPGSVVSRETDGSEAVKAISNLDNMTMIDVAGPGMKGMVGMASRVFAAISNAGVSVSLITQSSSEYSVSFCVASNDAKTAQDALERAFELELKNEFLEPIRLKSGLSIVSLIGDGMKTRKGIAAKFLNAIAAAGANLVALAQGSSERSISAVVNQQQVKNVLVASHRCFFDDSHDIDVLLVGAGNIGKELLEQIKGQQQVLAKQKIRMRLCAVTNSSKMHLDEQGIDLESWQDELAASEQAADLTKLRAWISDAQLRNPVLVDCTSNDAVAQTYPDFMAAGAHVVTPNKKANTGSLGYYQKLRHAALVNKRQFLYETTVGAGLPVIDNLKKLVAAGDELHKFNGILSGSLSYIFGELEAGMSLSEATKIARDKGFTEPDPRDDLSGMDVARKVLILAREAGFNLEIDDINIEGVLPDNFDATGSVEEFMQRLPELDAWMADMIASAKQEGKVLRYVGEIDEQGCKVGIAKVAADEPLFSVKGGENALAFYSRYYQPLPFVLRGYGAGGAVTAAGVFADVLRTANWTREVTQ
ncbi:bifunctional aspartate kinase/homoserine dehydrogenase I [Paraferrimonas sp. SM1919]|uniref:bifunctional aspartate kinase/homoserine dehydrogenase I n=1 Tax=Paraferrimonas sp. SM1919 TaxID=2662263 RepID=UPI0013D88D56|nr:bifunctional aspartate kinase/homoserine dehydrogenase I [Paraferrimonas sp. SM1919]